MVTVLALAISLMLLFAVNSSANEAGECNYPSMTMTAELDTDIVFLPNQENIQKQLVALATNTPLTGPEFQDGRIGATLYFTALQEIKSLPISFCMDFGYGCELLPIWDGEKQQYADFLDVERIVDNGPTNVYIELAIPPDLVEKVRPHAITPVEVTIRASVDCSANSDQLGVEMLKVFVVDPEVSAADSEEVMAEDSEEGLAENAEERLAEDSEEVSVADQYDLSSAKSPKLLTTAKEVEMLKPVAADPDGLWNTETQRTANKSDTEVKTEQKFGLEVSKTFIDKTWGNSDKVSANVKFDGALGIYREKENNDEWENYFGANISGAVTISMFNRDMEFLKAELVPKKATGKPFEIRLKMSSFGYPWLNKNLNENNKKARVSFTLSLGYSVVKEKSSSSRFTIGPVPIKLTITGKGELGVKGEITPDLNSPVFTVKIRNAGPYIELGGSASAGVDYVAFGGGVRVNVTFVTEQVGVDITAQLKSGTVKLGGKFWNNVEGLKGNIELYVT
jgi:hypothetical protein